MGNHKMQLKRIVVLSFAFSATFIFNAALANTSRQVSKERLITRSEAAELYEQMSDRHGWSREEMQQALQITRGVRDLFNIYARLYNQEIPPQAIARSFRVCDGYASVIEDYWRMIQRYHFPPREVDTVFQHLPGEIMRHYYFHYRSGGRLSARREHEGDIPLGRPGNKYSMDECLRIFRDAQSDLAVIQPYFQYRDNGLSPRSAWNRIEEKTRERIKEEEERKQREIQETEDEKKERLKRAEEGRKRAAELLGLSDEEEDDDEEPQQRRRGYSLDELLAGTPSASQEEESENEPEGARMQQINNGVEPVDDEEDEEGDDSVEGDSDSSES